MIRPIKDICMELDSGVNQKFAKDSLPVVGGNLTTKSTLLLYVPIDKWLKLGYFFLRFICPAMFVPENYGIIYTSASTVSPYLYSVNHGRVQKSVVGKLSFFPPSPQIKFFELKIFACRGDKHSHATGADFGIEGASAAG